MNTQLIIEIIIVVAIVIIFALWLAWQLKKKGLKKFAVDMIVKAEDMYKKGQNTEKMNYVIDKVIALIPMPLKLFITRENVKKFIQNVFDGVKAALDYQKKGEI